jgi:hypothetical protein
VGFLPSGTPGKKVKEGIPKKLKKEPKKMKN